MFEERKNRDATITPDDLHLFNEGAHFRLYDKLGAHLTTVQGVDGTHFAVWAPDAEQVCVMGGFNDWSKSDHPLQPQGQSGVWAGFVRGVTRGTRYKYHIVSRHAGYRVDKADPMGFYHEEPPRTASVVWDLDREWGDAEWMAVRAGRHALTSPISVYEVHLGSWMRARDDGESPLTYREVAHRLAAYVRRLGFTHVELLPVMEHPFYGSWGYQTTGYFAPTARYGTPQDFMYLVDHLHQNGIGVLLDWVPSHFPTDEHGLGYFDGSHLYEHASPEQGLHPDWGTLIFNYGRPEVISFLISSALFWLDRYHVDGLRVDAVASMLYLDYSRAEGEWIPNRYGGRENIEAIDLLRRCNQEVYRSYPDVQTIAEESTAWPMVSRPTELGGLGFGLKWDMGWMHDTLEYMSHDAIYRRYHHNELVFRNVYAFSENFMLPLSHDEIVHGKRSLLSKMPGDDWQKLANLRLLLAYMYAQPGKKLLFMGGEFGQWREWAHDESLDWQITEYDRHAGLQRLMTDLNALYRAEPALHVGDCDVAGFEWIDASDAEASVLAFLRRCPSGGADIAVVCNFTPVVRANYRIGVPSGGIWREVLNSDATEYYGSGKGNLGSLSPSPSPLHGRPHSLSVTLPPLAAIFLKSEP
ncbi:MAG: 1,4-alpha-glucan branching protein GlgB [Chloroflexi bacterium]|nr:1,4-alpha-glucan branching protein GlgB [Chloroflexota bacterium]